MPRWARAALVGLATIAVVAIALAWPIAARGEAWLSAKWLVPWWASA